MNSYSLNSLIGCLDLPALLASKMKIERVLSWGEILSNLDKHGVEG